MLSNKNTRLRCTVTNANGRTGKNRAKATEARF